MAYVLGFFTADGNMNPHSNGGHYLEFTSCDRELISKTRNILKSNHKISARNRSTDKKTAYRIQIGSKILYRDLVLLGLTPNKSLTIKFPRIPKQYLGDFIRGDFDGDGCVYFRKNWAKDRNKPRWVFQTRFTSGSKHFLKSLHSILKSNKICKGGYLYTKKGGYELVFSHHDGLALFHFMYDNVSANVYLKRKYQTFQKAIKILNLGA
ncbi:MAG: LAGLIDADG family homing endonuclease [bacterium]|nr:LAGLIDADG family homing endonuclease [bacterium]